MIVLQVVDTNGLLRYLLADHAEHYQRASDFMEEVKQGTQRAFLAESVLTECVFVLQKFYKVPRERISYELMALLNYQGIEVDNLNVCRLALKLFGENKVDIVDAVVFAHAKIKVCQWLSFDNDLRKLESSTM